MILPIWERRIVKSITRGERNMNRKKNWLFLAIMLLCIVVALCGCGSETTESSTKKSNRKNDSKESDLEDFDRSVMFDDDSDYALSDNTEIQKNEVVVIEIPKTPTPVPTATSTPTPTPTDTPTPEPTATNTPTPGTDKYTYAGAHQHADAH